MKAATAATSAPHERLHALDGLRAVAVTLVLFHHLGGAATESALAGRWYAWLGTLVSQGTASGVELFFVLSAIVLVRPYASGARHIDLTKYFWRRAQRLYPPFWAAWLLSGVAIFVATSYPTWWTVGASLPRFTWHDWFAQLGLIYVGVAPFNFAWWSLTVEVCFYIAVPALVPLLVRTRSKAKRRAALFLGSVMLSQIGYALISTTGGAEPHVLPLSKLLVYASCFCGGLLLAQKALSRAGALAAMIGGALWVALALLDTRMNQHVGWGAIHLGAVSLALARGTPWSRSLSRPAMVWLGERSYSLFLSHYAVIGLVCQATSLVVESKGPVYFGISRLASFLLSIWVAMLLFHFVERRFARNLATADLFWPPLLARESMEGVTT